MEESIISVPDGYVYNIIDRATRRPETDALSSTGHIIYKYNPSPVSLSVFGQGLGWSYEDLTLTKQTTKLLYLHNI